MFICHNSARNTRKNSERTAKEQRKKIMYANLKFTSWLFLLCYTKSPMLPHLQVRMAKETHDNEIVSSSILIPLLSPFVRLTYTLMLLANLFLKTACCFAVGAEESQNEFTNGINLATFGKSGISDYTVKMAAPGNFPCYIPRGSQMEPALVRYPCCSCSLRKTSATRATREAATAEAKRRNRGTKPLRNLKQRCGGQQIRVG